MICSKTTRVGLSPVRLGAPWFVQNELTVLNPTSLIEMDTNGQLVAVKIDAQNTPLLLLGTYWPSGSSVEALKLRKELQAQIAHLIENNSQAVLFVIGDMNATLYDDDRSSSLRYPADVIYRQFVAESQLSPIDAKHGEIQELQPLKQWTHQQATANSGKNLNTQYTNSTIDDMLLPAKIASRVSFNSKCYLGYQSDHIPLYTKITIDILNCQIQRPQTSQPMNGNKNQALARLVSEADQLSFTNAILDPAYDMIGLLQKLEVIMRSLNPIYDEARGFLTFLNTKNEIE